MVLKMGIWVKEWIVRARCLQARVTSIWTFCLKSINLLDWFNLHVQNEFSQYTPDLGAISSTATQKEKERG